MEVRRCHPLSAVRFVSGPTATNVVFFYVLVFAIHAKSALALIQVLETQARFGIKEILEYPSERQLLEKWDKSLGKLDDNAGWQPANHQLSPPTLLSPGRMAALGFTVDGFGETSTKKNTRLPLLCCPKMRFMYR